MSTIWDLYTESNALVIKIRLAGLHTLKPLGTTSGPSALLKNDNESVKFHTRLSRLYLQML